jgi:hypothetical protein
MSKMNTILPEFNGSTERILNNFYCSFLAINFINLRPYNCDITLSGLDSVMTAASINSFDEDDVQEYGNSIRRHFLNDLIISYERYSTIMYMSHENGQVRKDPYLVKTKLYAKPFEQLTDIYDEDEKEFFKQLRYLRNSKVHYNGVYNENNELSYNFGFAKV